jgi:oxygen-independent coproporphyrinogen-3 oxidase
VPRAAYIHVPFCRHRCGYCNFSVVADRDDLIERFLVAIDRELAGWSRPAVDSVFLGGGTPSHLGAEQLDRLLHLVRARLELEPSVE